MLPAPVKTGVEQLLSTSLAKKVTIDSYSTIGGGCIHQAGCITTNLGEFFLKWNNKPNSGKMFETEMMGLSLLGETNTIQVPKQIATGEQDGYCYIVLEMIDSRARSETYWTHMGLNLAALHKHTQTIFGLNHDNFIGSLEQYNRPCNTWKEFFATQRLDPQIKMAIDGSKMPLSIIKKFERFYQRIDEIMPTEQPALLHGDLWSGNVISNEKGEAVFIDPAVYYGHREAELAFTTMFGGFAQEFYQAYQSAWPLTAGFMGRLDYYNLYPLLVHVNLFGGGYLNEVLQIIKKFK